MLRALRCVRSAGGRIELERLGADLAISRAELDRLVAHAEDERRALVRIWQEIPTGRNHVILTAAGERVCDAAPGATPPPGA